MSFESDIEKFVEKTKDRLDRVVRASALKLFSDIVMTTPVDTGRARANWQPEINGVPNSSIAFEGEKGSGKNDDEDTARRERNGSKAASMAIAEITDKTTSFEPLKGGKIGIYNNLVYIQALEYGHSHAQAPDGMVRLNAQNFPAIVESLARNEK